MRARAVVGLTCGFALGVSSCGGSTKGAAPVARETGITASPQIVELTYLEAERSFGRSRIAELTLHGSSKVRARAVRALGRLGDDESLDLLDQLVGDGDKEVRAEVIRALGMAGATRRATLLARSYQHEEDHGLRKAALRALGRIGGAQQLSLLTTALREGVPEEKEAAAVAMGIYGRRELALDDQARKALTAAANDAETGVRFGVAYALAREHEPKPSETTTRVLKSLAKDPDAEVRATAIDGLSTRGLPAKDVYVGALEDDDWRVRLAGVRALAGKGSNISSREFLAAWLAREWTVLASLEGLAGPRIHVVTEGLRALAQHARETAVQTSAVGLFDASAKFLDTESVPEKRLGAGHVNCLAAALRVRGGAPLHYLVDCGGGSESEVPLYHRQALVAEVLGAGFGGEPAERAAKLRELAAAPDPRVRAAAMTAAGAAFARSEAVTRKASAELLRAGLSDSAVEVVGAAVEAIGTLLQSKDEAVSSPSRALLQPLLALAAKIEPSEAELRLTLVAALTGVAEATDICRAAHDHPVAAVREAARACIKAATGRDLGLGSGSRAPERPPVKPAGILGKQVTWTVETTRGEFEIALDPDAAPWHVAVLLRLSDEKVYDNVIWHRVVPGFVSQTGDPTGSGWGGPGYFVPSEPSARSFVRGAVGIAEAGKDTGGSQWFVCHERAPHLDGQYTFVGMVTKGEDVLESLEVGDRVLGTSMAITRRPAPAPASEPAE